MPRDERSEVPGLTELPPGAVVGLTGTTGHLGQVLLERLLRQDVEVRSVARRPLVLPRGSRVAHTCADIRSPAARQALEGTDLVFHLAAQVWEGQSAGAGGMSTANGQVASGRAAAGEAAAGEATLGREVPGGEAMRQVNVSGTSNVLAARPGAVVLASSATVYGAWPDNPLPLSEGHVPRPNPECPYAEHKLAAEQACQDWDGRWVALRLCAVLGPHADVRVARSLAGYRLAVPEVRGSPQATQWIDEADAVDGLLAAGRDLLGPGRAASQVVNIATRDWLGAPDMARLARSRRLRASRGLVMGAAELGRRARFAPFGADRAALICGPLALGSAKALELWSWSASRSSEEVFAAALARGWQGARRNR